MSRFPRLNAGHIPIVTFTISLKHNFVKKKALKPEFYQSKLVEVKLQQIKPDSF